MGRPRRAAEHPRPRSRGPLDPRVGHRRPEEALPGRTSSAIESDEPKFGALAVTEPQAGSDVSNVQTTAVRDGDDWVLNGTKMYCTNGARAEIVVVNATVDKSLGRQGQKFFVIEKGTPGFKIGKIEKKMGLTASETAELDPRGLPHPVRQHPRWCGGARAEGLRLQRHDEDVRLVATLGRGDGAGYRAGRVRVLPRLGCVGAPDDIELHAARPPSSRSSAR